MFPSPVGESYFSIEKDDLTEAEKKGFRPLSGNLIFQFTSKKGRRKHGTKFPSPVGESYFSIKARACLGW